MPSGCSPLNHQWWVSIERLIAWLTDVRDFGVVGYGPTFCMLSRNTEPGQSEDPVVVPTGASDIPDYVVKHILPASDFLALPKDGSLE